MLLHLSFLEKWCLTLYLLFMVFAAYKAWGEECYNKKLLSAFQNRYILQVKKVIFVKAIIGWCAAHLGYPPGYKKLPAVEISYYPHKKLLGLYYFHRRLIKVFINSHTTIPEIVDTTIHEYIHFLEINSASRDQEYSKLHQQEGYLKNPYEISARKSQEHVPKAIDYLMEKGYLKKV